MISRKYLKRAAAYNHHKRQKCILSHLNYESFFVTFVKIAKSDYYLCHASPSAWNNSGPDGRIFMKFYISVFFENL